MCKHPFFTGYIIVVIIGIYRIRVVMENKMETAVLGNEGYIGIMEEKIDTRVFS